MSEYNEQLPLANGKIAPSYYNPNKSKYEYLHGDAGAAYMKDLDVKRELELVKAELQEMKLILKSFIG